MFINLCAQKILETMKSKSESWSNMSYSATPWTVAHQSPLSMGFSRQESWSGLLCPYLTHKGRAHLKVISGESNGNPLQYPCLENLMDGGAW